MAKWNLLGIHVKFMSMSYVLLKGSMTLVCDVMEAMVIEFARKALYNKWHLKVNNHYEALT
jgi:hypothetical protein